MTTVKTPDTLTRAARRALASAPQQYALSADAHRVLIAVRTATRQIHRTPDGETPTRQRFVDLGDVRIMLDMRAGRFDRAVRELAGLYLVWLRVLDGETTGQQDRESVRHNGADFHQVSADDWRLGA